MQEVGQSLFGGNRGVSMGNAGSWADTFLGGNRCIMVKLGVGHRHLLEETEVHPGNVGGGAVTFRRKQSRIQAMLGVGQIRFLGGNRCILTTGNAGSGV